ncbi:hypothetical protein GJAV_G00106470 [Gymnothorax javanicus]|nr:hypothetical protein GJAV_G00106470 [Gymnothorax javanicus]
MFHYYSLYFGCAEMIGRQAETVHGFCYTRLNVHAKWLLRDYLPFVRLDVVNDLQRKWFPVNASQIRAAVHSPPLHHLNLSTASVPARSSLHFLCQPQCMLGYHLLPSPGLIPLCS